MSGRVCVLEGLLCCVHPVHHKESAGYAAAKHQYISPPPPPSPNVPWVLLCRYVEELVAAEVAGGLPSDKVVVAGFSQGGAIALTMLRSQQKLAGVVGAWPAACGVHGSGCQLGRHVSAAFSKGIVGAGRPTRTDQ